MRKQIILWVVLVLLSRPLFVQSLDRLSEQVARDVIDFFAAQDNIRLSIVKFENFTGFSDLLAQRFYQMVAAGLEREKGIHFRDLMVNFTRNQGLFNLRNAGEVNHLLYIKLIKNREKIGAGVVIFSKNLDKIVSVQYREALLESGEKEVLNTVSFGFQSAGFSRLVEIDASRDLLDVRTIPGENSESLYAFYYPDRISLFRMAGGQLEKDASIPLDWGRPFFPVLEREGKLCAFSLNQQLYMAAGNNFSSAGKIFQYQADGWKEISRIHFVPFRLVEINERFFLAGGEYDDGRNFFKPKLVMLPVEGMSFQPKEYFEKKIPAFFALDFVLAGSRLVSVHLVDREYRYRFYAADLEEMDSERIRKGGAVCSSSPEWVALSDYSRNKDRLFFYRVSDGGKSPVYQNRIEGEVVFISDGNWKATDGFWVYVRKKQKYGDEFSLQFWAKSGVEKTVTEPAESGEKQP